MSFITIVAVALIKKPERVVSPSFVLLVSWAFIVGLYLFSGVKYTHNINFYSGIYLLFHLITFMSLYYVGLRVNYKNKIQFSFSELDDHKIINTKPLFFLSSLGMMFWLYDLIRLNTIIFGFRIQDKSLSVIGVLGLIILLLSLFVWIYELLRSIIQNTKIPKYALLSGIYYLVPAILSAGRQNILIFGITTIMAYIAGINRNPEYKYKKRIYLLILSLVIPLFLYVAFITNIRAGVSNKELLFVNNFNISISQETREIIDGFGNFKNFVLEAIIYYSHEIPMFGLFFENYDGPKMLGAFQFPYISRRLPSSINLDYLIPWEYIDRYSNSHNVASHVWRTAVYQFVVDFGYLGSFIWTMILGFFSGVRRQKFLRRKSIYELVVQIIVCAGLVFSVQYSPFTEGMWAYPFYWALLIKLYSKFKIGYIRVKATNSKVRSTIK